MPDSPVAPIKRVIRGTFVLACIAFARTAYGFLDPPYLTPALPVAGDTISVSIRGGICDGVGTIPGYPQITRQGNTIRIVLWGVSVTDPILCNIPIGTVTYAVGAYTPGSYTLQVDRNYQDDLGGIVTETLGVIPFAVVGGAVQTVALPTLNLYSLGTLGFVLVVVARSKLRRLTRSP